MIKNNILNQESPLKQSYDSFDIDNIGLSIEEYKKYAMGIPIQQTNQLLKLDWTRRIASKGNVIFSGNGITGSGKSSFLSSCCLMLGNICDEVLHLPYKSFTVDNVYYEPEELQERIKTNFKLGEILLRDEHLKGQAGMMSDLNANFLTDAEQQLRKNQNSFAFASIEEEDHAHFFKFSMKHQIPDSNGFPRAIVAMLETPRYTDPNIFVWRGLVAMPFPSKAYWTAYEKRKDEHILKLKAQYGNTLTPVGIDAVKIYRKRHDDLITKTREGLIKPVKDELMDIIVSEEIGTRKYTNKGYSILKSQIRDYILREYLKHNESRQEEINNVREKSQLEKRELILMQMEEAKRIKEAKLIAFNEKLAEDKKRNELKKRALDIREKELANAKLVKEEKELAKKSELEKKIDRKKIELAGSPAKHFAEELA